MALSSSTDGADPRPPPAREQRLTGRPHVPTPRGLQGRGHRPVLQDSTSTAVTSTTSAAPALLGGRSPTTGTTGLFGDFTARTTAQNLAASLLNSNRGAERALLAAGRERIVRMDLGTGLAIPGPPPAEHAAGCNAPRPSPPCCPAPLLVNRAVGPITTPSPGGRVPDCLSSGRYPGAWCRVAPHLSNATFPRSRGRSAASCPANRTGCGCAQDPSGHLAGSRTPSCWRVTRSALWQRALRTPRTGTAPTCRPSWRPSSGTAARRPTPANIRGAQKYVWGVAAGVAMDLPACNAFARQPGGAGLLRLQGTPRRPSHPERDQRAAPDPADRSWADAVYVHHRRRGILRLGQWRGAVPQPASCPDLPGGRGRLVRTSVEPRRSADGNASTPAGSSCAVLRAGPWPIRRQQDGRAPPGHRTVTSTYVGGLIKDALQ